jgi:hypothetical protein
MRLSEKQFEKITDAEWEGDENLRGEFRGNLSAYRAYRRSELNGQSSTRTFKNLAAL